MNANTRRRTRMKSESMKARVSANMVRLVLLLLLGSVFTTRAWYEPNVQRWVNRDPLGDQGSIGMRSDSRRLTSTPIVERTQALNLHTFVNNDPCDGTDPSGEYSIRWIPFPCPISFQMYCIYACAQQHMTPNPKCSVVKIGGEWFIRLDCGCFIAPWQSCE